MTTVHDVLVRARQIITPPEAWTQGALARGKNSEPVPVSFNDAVCFCSYGANQRASFELKAGFRICAVADDALRAAAGMGVATFNDSPSRSHAEVLAVFDKAIEETA